MLYLLGIWASNVQIHVFIALSSCRMLHKSRATALNLHTAARFLLDMLDICTPVTYNLSSQIETWDRFKIDGDFLLWPFALHNVSNNLLKYDIYLLCRTRHAQRHLALVF